MQSLLAFGLIAVGNSCKQDVLRDPPPTTSIFVYNNLTEAVVRIEGYDGDEIKAVWTIEPGGTLSQVDKEGVASGYETIALSSCEQLRVAFDDVKEMKFRQFNTNDPSTWNQSFDLYGNLTFYRMDSWMEHGEWFVNYTYDFTQEMMDAAEPIVK